MTDERTIKAGSLFCFSEGEYSDYSYMGHFVALEDITPQKLFDIGEGAKAEEIRFSRLVEEWRRKPSDERGAYPGSPDVHGLFIAAVIRAGLALSVTCSELHIGSYGRLEIEA